MEYVLETEKLTKQYGAQLAADSISLHIPRGTIYGFIGRNGAGKTTCMKMICGLTHPTSGTIRILGLQNSGYDRIGSLIEDPGLYYNMTAAQNLRCRCILTGSDPKKTVMPLLETVGLANAANKNPSDYSLGMRQRLGIALALVGDPEILVLDEPINGLDPQGIVQVRDMLRSLVQERNLTIMISSHILGELEKLADVFGIIHKGRLMKEIPAAELSASTSNTLEIRTDDTAKVCSMLAETAFSASVTGADTVQIRNAADRSIEINRMLIQGGCGIIESRIIRSELEDYYLELTGGAEK
ncbi:MAG TPA: bacitracin ABC transporter ATP-binding protein [Ruminococcus sp.]|nr:bacitracin ABC transporter ATP-binding protein [Ruminococcus sp.]